MSGACLLPPHEAFGQVLRKHRLAVGLSQEQLGLESGVQKNLISLIERGQNPANDFNYLQAGFSARGKTVKDGLRDRKVVRTRTVGVICQSERQFVFQLR